jgi:tetratricopeptide (TPR) repeat protein
MKLLAGTHRPAVHVIGAFAIVLLLHARAAAQIPARFTNLQVLPKDISRAELVANMRNIAGALGVRCTHCHVGPDNLEGMDFATDVRPSKQVARAMMRMVQNVNSNFINALPAADRSRQQVMCITCHRRSVQPPRPLSDLLLATIAADGVPAAVGQYRKLRAELLDSGLYDFREPTLNIVATSLRERKDLAAALEVLRLNAEVFPRSAAVQVNLGDTAAAMGDVAAARGFYRRALELEPGNAAATRGLANLEKK